MSLRTPGSILPLLGVSADSKQLASEQSSPWRLVHYTEMQGGEAAQEQLLNIYILTSVLTFANGADGSADNPDDID